jgi:3-oxoadipate CoA-transferase, beta subunit
MMELPNTVQPLSRESMARAAARDIPEGMCVNLGIGAPTLIADHIPSDREILIQSEQGLLGLGPKAAAGEEDEDVLNAGKFPVTLLPGASIFSHSDSFMMIRGGHIELAVLGAFQVASNGDLANWNTGDASAIPGVGGAMDLAAGAKAVWVLMDHNAKDGAPRLLESCSFPLTAAACVDRIYTNLAVIDVVDARFVVRRMVRGLTSDGLQAATGAPLIFDADCGVYEATSD